jgi:hypothetical protein
MGLFGVQLSVEGAHNSPYGLGDSRCGPGNARLPEPDFQSAQVEGEARVFSGQTVSGNICFMVAANDVDSLLLDYNDPAANPQDTWFALK